MFPHSVSGVVAVTPASSSTVFLPVCWAAPVWPPCLLLSGFHSVYTVLLKVFSPGSKLKHLSQETNVDCSTWNRKRNLRDS